MWRGCRELNSDLKVRSLAPSSVGPHPHMEAAERFELSSSEVEARSIDPLCYTASLLLLVRDVGIEPTSSRLKGECISISANPANLVGDAGIEPAWSRLRGECISHLCQSPMFKHQSGTGCWNRTNASRLSTAGSTFELILHGAPFGS